MTNEVDHSARAHSRLGASSTHRWWPCLGSNNLIAALGVQDTPSIYMLEGTAAHELAHLCLVNGQDAIEYISRKVEEFIVNDEMASAVQIYLDKCRIYLNDPEWECFVEQKFSLEHLKPPVPMFGTADFVAINKVTGEVVVIDLKYGANWIVQAEKNPQLMYYALGVMCAFARTKTIRKIRGIIVQPRARFGDPIKEAEFRPAELFIWQDELIARAYETIKPDAPLTAGPHCKSCGARGRCQAQTDAAYDAAQLEFTAETLAKPVEELPKPPIAIGVITPDELGKMYAQVSFLRAYADSVEEALRSAITDGIEGTGYKLIGNLGHRAWNGSDVEIGKKLASRLGFDENELYETALFSPAEIEKRAIKLLRDVGVKAGKAKEMVKKELDKLTTRPPAKPSIVLLTDERPALPARGAEFDYLPAPETT